jgi:hypothetical protein
MKEPKPCFRCDGTGNLCNGCGESENVCIGDCGEDPDELCGHDDCPDCKGTGESKTPEPEPVKPKRKQKKV